ncbi:MAG TPA: glutamine synthetase III [Butyricicoccus pullicaecorum]|uniref:Glutamine synthetase type III n=1 Tax=Butyricicoccus pullicaecorum TaxID=501571 RepID=A0A1Y4L7U0_9FIRM|nr:glutamine synthetase III [Butyricicoccus pullicaecorum]OUP52805.1 glutamine synthetase type III [Butyricicoccus pullicaecorum]HJF53027.1 glutamine synthetase III [Butyricicoccus pullicaecorum]
MSKVPELFGSMVFNESVMKERLPKDVFKALKSTITEGTALDPTVANIVANAMKDWAISMGATHYTHWFQPMTGITAEKHDSFITPGAEGAVIMEFSGKELIKGEPDASSFPSGGLRATFEARGYTAWDPTSYAFIKDHTLCIPTAFCSYTGQILDKKTPLLRSMEAISKQACRVLRLFGKDCKHVTTTVGPEQEYFLINKSDYAKRPDLILTGRTLFGAPAPKGQEMDDHYFGSIRPRVKAFMAELDEELWKLGIYSKTEHNEVAPCQHEMAPIFETTNIAVDHNQLTMEVMKRVADRHGFVCLLHEKPFEGINGSGKHNNWSISTDRGENLLEPGNTPSSNAQFLLFLTAVIKAVDEYQDLLRLSAASAGNDHRLGAHEAPPAVVSMYIGDELGAVVDAMVSGKTYHAAEKTHMDIGVSALPNIPKDTSDRNRTSPFAFTGNKFEFRMPGSTFNVACTNTILNTAVAEELRQFADELEQAENFEQALSELIIREIKAHKRIIFNGNGYDDAWLVEAKKRGLSNLASTPDALPHYTDKKNLQLFTRHGVYTPVEVGSREEILLEEYAKTLRIEALTMLDMLRKLILPACAKFSRDLAEGVALKKQIGVDAPAEVEMVRKVTDKTAALSAAQDVLAHKVEAAKDVLTEAFAVAPGGVGARKLSRYYRDEVLPAMKEARKLADELENLVSKEYWPFPTYSDILFYV